MATSYPDSMQTNTNLRVLIFPYIPDLNKDGLASLRNHIKREFEAKNTDITLVVEGDSSHNLYDLDNMRQYLGTGPSAFDVAEVDMILLGEMANENLLEPNPDPSIEVDSSSFFPFAVNAVTYGGTTYGIPTLVCANFLAKMTSPTGSGTLQLIGNFRSSWTLPGYYLSAYVNAYGASFMYEGVNSDPNDHEDVVNSIKQLSDRCMRNDGSNPCTNKDYRIEPEKMTEDVIRSKESHFLAYAEVIGEVLHKNPAVEVESIAPPRLGGSAKYLQMYTDALVANRNTYQSKKEAIKRFMEFYTSDDFRHSYAFCGDMVGEDDTSCTRYVLAANTNFYQNSRVKENSLYQQLYGIINDRGISAPNSEIYYRRGDLDRALSTMLEYDKKDEL